MFLCKVVDSASSDCMIRCRASTFRNSLCLRFFESFLHSYITMTAVNQAFWSCKKNWACMFLCKVCFAQAPGRLDSVLKNAESQCEGGIERRVFTMKLNPLQKSCIIRMQCSVSSIIPTISYNCPTQSPNSVKIQLGFTLCYLKRRPVSHVAALYATQQAWSSSQKKYQNATIYRL